MDLELIVLVGVLIAAWLAGLLAAFLHACLLEPDPPETGREHS